jgi:hypothetical protein
MLSERVNRHQVPMKNGIPGSTTPPPLRLLIFDDTCRGRPGLPGLSHAWKAGRHLYRALGRLDAGHPSVSWADALDWLGTFRAGAPISEIQFWGHGRWGEVRIGGEVLDASALDVEHPLWPRLDRIRKRLVPGQDALWWFRTCDTFGTARGQDFARAWTRFFGCRAAGHTHRIGIWQSGLHTLSPGARPTWSVDEGVTPGGAAAPSRAGLPNTVSFLHGHIPDAPRD